MGTGRTSFPEHPIGPILEHYGFEPIEEDRGWHAVRCAFHGDRRASGRVRTDESEEQVYTCLAYDTCPRGNAVQIIMLKEGLEYRDAVQRAEEITDGGGGTVRPQRGGRPSVPRKARDQSSVREFRRTWLGE